jgi:hypothetical protein
VFCFQGIMAAIQLYDEHRGHLPRSIYTDGDGRVLGSWRFEVLPEFGWSQWPNVDMKSPWSTSTNRAAASNVPWYCLEMFPTEDELDTRVFAVTGPGTAFDPPRKYSLKELPSHLILLIEIAHSHVPWMAPGDLDVTKVPEKITSGVDGEGVMVAFADGAIWHLRRDIPLADLKKFFTIEGAKEYNREQLLRPYVMESTTPAFKQH